MTVAENVTFWGKLRTPKPDIIRALTAFGLKDLENMPVQFLSAGQKQRVNLARIVAAPANLWLLDEPATSLDTDAIAFLSEIISAHRRNGGIVIVSTHHDLKLTNSATLHLDDFTGKGSALV